MAGHDEYQQQIDMVYKEYIQISRVWQCSRVSQGILIFIAAWILWILLSPSIWELSFFYIIVLLLMPCTVLFLHVATYLQTERLRTFICTPEGIWVQWLLPSNKWLLAQRELIPIDNIVAIHTLPLRFRKEIRLQIDYGSGQINTICIEKNMQNQPLPIIAPEYLNHNLPKYYAHENYSRLSGASFVMLACACIAFSLAQIGKLLGCGLNVFLLTVMIWPVIWVIWGVYYFWKKSRVPSLS